MEPARYRHSADVGNLRFRTRAMLTNLLRAGLGAARRAAMLRRQTTSNKTGRTTQPISAEHTTLHEKGQPRGNNGPLGRSSRRRKHLGAIRYLAVPPWATFRTPSFSASAILSHFAVQ